MRLCFSSHSIIKQLQTFLRLLQRDAEKQFHFMAPFLAMAKLKQAWLCSSGLTKTFHIMAHFLAMAKLKQTWLCSSGLTKTFILVHLLTPLGFLLFH